MILHTRLLLLACLLTASVARAESHEHLCRWSAAAAPGDAAGQQYAPHRLADFLHLALDVTPDFRARSVAGTATLRFKPIAQPLDELRLDAVDLRVTNVTATVPIAAWHVTDTHLHITFAALIPAAQEATVTVAYSATPRRGLYFRTPEMGYATNALQIWTQGEPIEARHWYPCFDAPNELLTTEITCRVPEGLVVLSNGKKVSEEKRDGLVAVKWLQDKPHVNYLVSLVAGHFVSVQEKHRDIPMSFWVSPADLPLAARSFEDTRDMMVFFERETGVPYPWAKYDQVCVTDYHWGGMENTSLSTLNADTLHTAASGKLRSSRGLVAHELAHQWFGDLVTCKDWSHLWLNEGFATYYDFLYTEHKEGRDDFLLRVHGGQKAIFDKAADPRPIVHRRFDNPEDQFSYLAYGKGAQVLHMIRSQLGPDLYRRCVQTYLQRHAHGNVVTADFLAVLEELSGRSWDRFFDQFVHNPRHPDLEADYAWDEKTKLARLSIRQSHPTNDAVGLFQLQLVVRFKTKSGVVERTLDIRQRAEDFFFPLPAAPETVRLNPDCAVLAKITFKPAQPLLLAQLADKSDALGRLLAIEQLESRQDAENVARLKEVLNNDPFHAVRARAAAALKAIHTDDAFAALRTSLTQPDERARRAVVEALGNFYRTETAPALLAHFRSEKNPDIQAVALAGLAPYSQPEITTLLLSQLRSVSLRDHLAEAALRALRAHDDPATAAPVLATLRERFPRYDTDAQATALGVLASLSRRLENRDDAREFLAAQTASLRRQVSAAAIAALGTLEDPRALPILETFATAAPGSPERKAADKAIADLNASKKPAVELNALRKEVLDLQKTLRDVRKELDTLGKKFDATAKPATNKPAGKK